MPISSLLVMCRYLDLIDLPPGISMHNSYVPVAEA
jgi:hypothetical protein